MAKQQSYVMILVSIVSLSVMASCFFKSSDSSEFSAIDNHLTKYANHNMFSGAVLVAKDGKVVLSKAYGKANIELDVANTIETKFRIASVTKQFTSMAIMQLQELGLLDVNDTLSKYISDYPRGDEITVHHLLTHTSGIKDFLRLPQFEKIITLPQTIEQVIDLFKSEELDFAPGKEGKYSNSGYVLLTYIIEKASGKKYEIFLKEHIFDPLRMSNTGYDHQSEILMNRAAGYQKTKPDYKIINAIYYDMSIPLGAGGLYSTVGDLYRWHQALRGEKLVKKSTLEKIFTSHTSLSGKEDKYGYGWFIGESFSRKRIEHGGSIAGFKAVIIRFPENDACIIILSNIADAPFRDLTEALTSFVFGKKYEIPQKHIKLWEKN